VNRLGPSCGALTA